MKTHALLPYLNLLLCSSRKNCCATSHRFTHLPSPFPFIQFPFTVDGTPRYSTLKPAQPPAIYKDLLHSSSGLQSQHQTKSLAHLSTSTPHSYANISRLIIARTPLKPHLHSTGKISPKPKKLLKIVGVTSQPCSLPGSPFFESSG